MPLPGCEVLFRAPNRPKLPSTSPGPKVLMADKPQGPMCVPCQLTCQLTTVGHVRAAESQSEVLAKTSHFSHSSGADRKWPSRQRPIGRRILMHIFSQSSEFDRLAPCRPASGLFVAKESRDCDRGPGQRSAETANSTRGRGSSCRPRWVRRLAAYVGRAANTETLSWPDVGPTLRTGAGRLPFECPQWPKFGLQESKCSGLGQDLRSRGSTYPCG